MQQAWRGREGVQPMMSNEFHPQRKLHYDQSRRPPPIQEQSINIELRPDVSSASHCCSCSCRHRGPQILTNQLRYILLCGVHVDCLEDERMVPPLEFLLDHHFVHYHGCQMAPKMAVTQSLILTSYGTRKVTDSTM